MQSGLGLDSRDGNRNWVGVHPAVASVYMTALADSISSRQGLNPVSDSASHLVAVGGWSVDRLATALLRTGPREEQLDIGDDSPAATLAFSALRTVTPANLSEVSAATIIDLRERYGPELVRFQDAIRIATEAAGLADIKDADSYESRLEEAYEDYVAPRVAALEHDLKLFGIETIPTYLSLRTTLPPIAAGALAELGVDDPATTTGAAVLLGVVSIQRRARARSRAALQSNPMAYMYRLSQEINPQSLRHRLREAIQRFAHGV